MAVKSSGKKGAWKHSRRIAWRKVADEAIILDVETAVYYSLTGVGLKMWELIGKGKTAPEVARILAQEYDAKEGAIAEDCAELISKLGKKKLVERA
jgi:hypothetical protein